MRKQSLTVLAGACAAALALAACSSGGSSTEGKGGGKAGRELTILSIATPSSPDFKDFKAAIAQFEQETGAKVKLTTGTGDTVTSQFESTSLAGKEPDLVNINPVGAVRNWLASGAVHPVDDYLDSWGIRGTVNPDAIKEWTIDGKVIGFPYQTFTWPLWFNTELLKKAGIARPPATMADLESDVDKLKAAGITPWAIGGSDWTGQDFVQKFIELYLPVSDYDSVFKQGKYCSNGHVMDALNELVKLRDKGLFAKDVQGLTSNDMTAAFNTGKAAMMLSGSWGFGGTPKDLLPKITVGGIPAPQGGAVTRPAFAVGYSSAGWIVSRNGAAKADLIRKFMEIQYSDPVVTKAMVDSGFVPAVAKVPAMPTDANPLLGPATKAVGETDRLHSTDSYIPPAVTSTYIKASAVAFTPGKSAQDTCSALEHLYTSAG
ncbi:extracellular solute-binding protein [Streptacidiphilus sp. ASG 303]|uniref:ABC transporter substrate-binding protein n=1 Tax=Streptacidiphilus sp. ASG 303 TaxID=2896847 RepID=UPI001E488D5C|nr:extracellular solute-binding protein [Streptacidiphilus sp. ASG 303]MCD0483575.1 extracellular solute-binding protein [Streptacidiphilus sp. ASG 303]